MHRKKFIGILTFALSNFLLPHAHADKPASPAARYTTDAASVVKMGEELVHALKAPVRAQLGAVRVEVVAGAKPDIHFEAASSGDTKSGTVVVTSGFVDLINYLSHARAMEKTAKGSFQKYLQALAQAGADSVPVPPPGLSNPANWNDNVLNEQMSNFNQIFGVVLGTQLAHQYLGNSQKYSGQASQAGNSTTPAFNQIVSPEEFDAAIKAGAHNALDCGFGIAGIKYIVEGFDKVQQRPAWAVYFLSDKSKLPKLRKDLEKLERMYFAGDF